MAKDEPNLSSHERALNIAEDLLQKGKARQEQLKQEGALTSALLGTTRDLNWIESYSFIGDKKIKKEKSHLISNGLSPFEF